MADTINVDIVSYNVLPKLVPIVGLPHPVLNYSIDEETLLKLFQIPNYVVYEAGTTKVINGNNIDEYFHHGGGGGEGGTDNYPDLKNKPSINGVTLRDNKSSADLNLIGIPTPSSSIQTGQLLVVKKVENGKITDLTAIDKSIIINDLDVDEVTLNKNQTLASIKETDGKISTTVQSIEIESNAVATMKNYINDNKTTTASAIIESDSLNKAIGKLEKTVDSKLDDGNYAASASKGGSATSAVALDSKNVGTATKGVYFDNNGKPVAMTHTLNEDVPTGAVFTDTTYSAETNSGINIDQNNKITNTGVRGFVDSLEADANGTLRINVNGVESTVTPKGLNTAAFKAVDTTPTLTSENVITSGGVATELDKKNDKIPTFKNKSEYEAAAAQGKVLVGSLFIIENDDDDDTTT